MRVGPPIHSQTELVNRRLAGGRGHLTARHAMLDRMNLFGGDPRDKRYLETLLDLKEVLVDALSRADTKSVSGLAARLQLVNREIGEAQGEVEVSKKTEKEIKKTENPLDELARRRAERAGPTGTTAR